MSGWGHGICRVQNGQLLIDGLTYGEPRFQRLYGGSDTGEHEGDVDAWCVGEGRSPEDGVLDDGYGAGVYLGFWSRVPGEGDGTGSIGSGFDIYDPRLALTAAEERRLDAVETLKGI